jgi:hypothetical protein
METIQIKQNELKKIILEMQDVANEIIKTQKEIEEKIEKTDRLIEKYSILKIEKSRLDKEIADLLNIDKNNLNYDLLFDALK